MSNIKRRALSNCLIKIIDYRGKTPKKLDSDWSTNGFRAISANNVKFVGLTKIDSINYVDAETYKKWMKEEVENGDLLLTSEAPAGQVMLWMSDEKIVLSQRLFGLRTTHDVYNKFLKYYLQSSIGQNEINKNTSGSTVFGISAKTFDLIQVLLPDYDSQILIGDLLYNIDCKIDLNKRINAELEAMAKKLYEYWFVQFDFPDQHGKPYKSSGGKMVWNDELKVEIPDGWNAKRLAEITEVSNESINPLNKPDKDFRHYSIPCFDETGTYKIEKGEEIKSNKFLVEETDILVSKLNPWFNRVIFSTDDEDLICSTEFVVWRPKNVALKYYLFMIARDESFISYCTKSASGTSNSHKRVNPTVMMRHQVAYNERVAELFGSKIESAIKMFAKNDIENQRLAELRNWLLPMLMNGQVTVKGKEPRRA